MSKYNCEILGVVHYSQDLSYHELYELEESLMEGFQGLMDRYGAEHLDFWAQGDALRLHSSMMDYDPEAMRHMGREAADMLPADVSCKLMAVQTDLASSIIFYISGNKLREGFLEFGTEFFRF